MYQIEESIIPRCSNNKSKPLLESLGVLFFPRAFSGRRFLAESAVSLVSRHRGFDTIAANDDISAVKIDKDDLGLFVLLHSCLVL